MGHFPVCGWLSGATAFIKWQVTNRWDDEVNDGFLHCMLTETVAKVCEMDPMRGDWCIDGSEMKVWVDISSVATGVALEVNGGIVENAGWVCPAEDISIWLSLMQQYKV